MLGEGVGWGAPYSKTLCRLCAPFDGDCPRRGVRLGLNHGLPTCIQLLIFMRGLVGGSKGSKRIGMMEMLSADCEIGDDREHHR